MTRLAFEDRIVRDIDFHASLYSGSPDVLQLLHGLFPHVLQLADMVVYVRDLDFASSPRAPRCHLNIKKSCLVGVSRSVLVMR